MSGFTKLDSGIVDSSVWALPPVVRVVWITLLAKCDKDGYARMSFSGLQRASNIPMESVQKAVDILSSPDTDSRTPDNEGRRIQKIDGGWHVLNYTAYRNNLIEGAAREYFTEQKRKQRSGRKDLDAPMGKIYYASDGGDEVKIGFSINPWARINELRTARPGISIIATEPGTIDTEKERHLQFSRFRKDGEWFAFSKEIREFVENLSRRRSEKVAPVVLDYSASAYASASVTKEGCGEEGGSTSHVTGNVTVFQSVEKRLCVLFSRKNTTITAYDEQSGVASISRRPEVLSELAEIEKWFKSEKKFLPRSLSRLVSEWDKFLDQARSWKPSRSPEEERRIKNLVASI